MFADGFGLYRNIYRSLMGIYLIIAVFTLKDRARKKNVLLLTLSPYGSKMNDVVDSITPFIQQLDGGIEIEINRVSTLVFTFIFAFVRDMP